MTPRIGGLAGLRNRLRVETEDLICRQLAKHRGNVSHTATAMRIGRATLHRWIARSPLLQRELRSARNGR